MKLIKILGLTAVSALMAMALFGASSASALHTALCATDVSLCASPLTHIHETTLSGNENRATLLNSILNVRCQVLFLGETADPDGLANPLVINGNFTYFQCNNFCSAEQVSINAKISELREGHELVKVTGEYQILWNCPFMHCVYTGAGLVGHGLGPLLSQETNGGVVIFNQKLTEALPKSPGCPDEGKLDIVTTPLSPVYISE